MEPGDAKPSPWTPLRKVSLVVGGYAACFLLAWVVVAVRMAATSGSARLAAGGMYGFGDAILFVAAFGVPALVPTGAALVFLRPHRMFWTVLSAGCIALSATGIAAVILFAVGRHEMATTLAELAQYSVPRILVSPLLTLGFLVCAALSPHRSPRLALFAAAVMESVVSAYAGAQWFIHVFLHRP